MYAGLDVPSEFMYGTIMDEKEGGDCSYDSKELKEHAKEKGIKLYHFIQFSSYKHYLISRHGSIHQLEFKLWEFDMTTIHSK